MPCRYGGPIDDHEATIARLNDVTSMLCRVLGRLRADQIDGLDADVRAWWADHQRRDLERRRLEEKQAQEREDRAAALRKLTPRERRLLGVR